MMVQIMFDRIIVFSLSFCAIVLEIPEIKLTVFVIFEQSKLFTFK